MNRCEVLTAYFRDKQSQRSIRMEFVIVMILFDVADYRLLYGIVRYRSVRVRRKYLHDKIFAYVHHLMFSVLKLVWIPIYCLV